MVSKYVLPAAIFFASVAFLIAWSVIEWNVVEETLKSLNGTKMIAVRTEDAMAMLSHMKVINSTIVGVCRKIYAVPPANREPDVLVLICGYSAYVFYLR
jgi:hypothetical protein